MQTIPLLEGPKEVMQFSKAAASPKLDEVFIMRHEDALPSNLKYAPPHKRQCFDITIITNCDYQRSINNIEQTYQGDFITFVGPYQTHSYHLPPVQPIGFSIFFTHSFASIGHKNSNFLSDFPFFSFSNHAVIPLTVKQRNALLFFYEKIYDEYHNRNQTDVKFIKAYLEVLLLEVRKLYLDDQVKSSITNHKDQVINDFMLMLSTDLGRHYRLKDYSESLNISPRYLSELLKKNTGKAALHHIQQRILTEAKTLIAQTSLSISEIGYHLSFKDASHFCKFFRIQTGLSPLQYRIQYNGRV
ncbi:MAG: helix-turn-helix domain-containing protein [Bacteroidota bacterium]